MKTFLILHVLWSITTMCIANFSSPTKLIDVFSFMMVCLHWMNATTMDPSLFVPRLDCPFEVIIIELFFKNNVWIQFLLFFCKLWYIHFIHGWHKFICIHFIFKCDLSYERWLAKVACHCERRCQNLLLILKGKGLCQSPTLVLMTLTWSAIPSSWPDLIYFFECNQRPCYLVQLFLRYLGAFQK